MENKIELENLGKIIDADKIILSDEDKLKLYSENYPFGLSLRIDGFQNEKEFFKFIKNCERLIRNSLEYKEWRRYITEVLQNNQCLITLEVNSQVTVEIHHHIPSLFTIVRTVTNKYIQTNKEFCTFDICLEIIKLHFLDKVGYVPLISSMHEKLHSGFLEIPTSLVKGNYKSFLDEYKEFIDDDDWETINERMSVTYSNTKWKKDEYLGLKKESENLNKPINDEYDSFDSEYVDKEILETVDKIRGVG